MRHPNDRTTRQSRLNSYDAAVKSTDQPADWRGHLRRWPMYAAAAGAALATATSAEAGNIVYGFSGETISVNSRYGRASGPIPLGSLGDQLTMVIGHGAVSHATASLLANGGVAGTKQTNDQGRNYRSRLLAMHPFAFGAPIGPSFSRSATRHTALGNGDRYSFGPFYFGKVNTRFLALDWQGDQFARTSIFGFELKTGGSSHDYGWIKLKWNLNSSVPGGAPYYVASMEAFQWAVNTTPNQPIDAGEAPEPSTLALSLLAAGAAGVMAWRKRGTI